MNESGYIIHPQGIWFKNLEDACLDAWEFSRTGPDETRVEDCDTKKTMARFCNGEEV
jgi:hypothetical protein